MSTAYVIVTALTAAITLQAAVLDFRRSEWIVSNMDKYGVPRSWLPYLGALKVAGAVGLLIGIWVPVIGIAAALGLVLYFIGAIVTVMQAHWYSHLRYPAPFLALSAASLVLVVALI
jgi:DoxX-like family